MSSIVLTNGESSLPAALPGAAWSLFETALGWVGLEGSAEAGVTRLFLGYHSPDALIAKIGNESWMVENDWEPGLRRRVTAHLSGQMQDFRDVRVAIARKTPFQQQVTAVLRQVAPGETLTYKELAARAGRPAAARAVGQVMSTNPVPLIIPCHRVLGCGNRLGGFTAPTGIDLKRRLLALEGIAPGSSSRAVPVLRTA